MLRLTALLVAALYATMVIWGGSPNRDVTVARADSRPSTLPSLPPPPRPATFPAREPRSELSGLSEQEALAMAMAAEAEPLAPAPAPPVAEVRTEAEPAAPLWYVTGSRVNLRAGPSSDTAIVGGVSLGDRAEVLTDPTASWVRIRTERGIEAWIYSGFLSEVAGIAGTDRTRSLLITGCSSGIGHDAAHSLARRGWRVFATCRAEADVARLVGEGLESLRLDVDDPGSIAAAVAEVLDRTDGRLDAVFNNAGFACPGAVEDLPVEALRAVLRTNVEGLHEVTRAVLPAMRRQGHGRIVNCSSVLGYVAAPWRGAYVASKFAVEGLTATLRLELRGSGIEVVTIQPGPVASELRRKAIPHFERWIDWRNSPHRERYEARLLRRLYERGDDRFQLPASAVSAVLIRALEDPTPRAHYRVTLPARGAWWLRRLAPTGLLDRILAGNG